MFMKTIRNFVLITVISYFISYLFENAVFAGIIGSKHDFSDQDWSGGEICTPCHAPHNTDSSISSAPLWNHQTTVAIFTMYDSPTLLIKTQDQPQGISKLCLSCHDGTVATDSFGANFGNEYIAEQANLTTDLSDDHPVSIKWQHQNDLPVCSNCHDIMDDLYSSVLPFYNGFVECATCHDVHNTTTQPKLLRLSMWKSELCFHCHDK